ncbi:MAG: transglycosylase SLT domain-containing protein [Terriglobales bacterium]
MANGAEFYPLIAAAAQANGLDWWLLYGVIEQESEFDPNAESSCGALGLMQLMPSTFPAWSRTSLLDPRNNLKLGAGFLKDSIAIWRQESPDEAIRFGLACYNGGSGYVLEAQKMALAAGLDSHAWGSVGPLLTQVEVNGLRPDYRQIQNYVASIWLKFEARRGLAPLEAAA